MIDVRQLAYFIAVVEAKSFTAAADVLHIAQPALSQHLQRLEQEFGQQLLVRHSRGVEPTPAGLRLVEHARSILTSVEAVRKEIRNFNEQPRGHVRVGLPRSLCDTLAVDFLSAWPLEHPNVNVQIVEQSSNTLMEWVLTGRLDLAVTSFPSDSSTVIAEPLMQDKLCAVLPRSGSSDHSGEIRFVELAQEPLILCSSSHITRQLIDMTAKYCSVQLKVAYEIDSPNLALKLVEAGLGTTIQPYLAMRKYMETGRADVRLIVGPGITRRLHLVRSRNRPLNVFELEVCKCLKAELLRHVTEANRGLDETAHDPPLQLDFMPAT